MLLANRMHASAHDVCRCGHERAAHEHYRGGTECSLCSPTACPRFRRPGIVSQLRPERPLRHRMAAAAAVTTGPTSHFP